MLLGVRRGLLIAGFATGLLWLLDATIERMAAGRAQADSNTSRKAARHRACPGIDLLDTSSASSCTLVGCSDVCMVTLTLPVGLAPGQYRTVFDLDGENIACRATVLSDGGGATIDCEKSVLVRSLHWFEGGEPQRHLLSFDGYPKTVSIALYRGQKRMASGRTDVTYHSNLPNGVGCSPACCQGGGSVVLTFGH